jgi:hypothetical protein
MRGVRPQPYAPLPLTSTKVRWRLEEEEVAQEVTTLRSHGTAFSVHFLLSLSIPPNAPRAAFSVMDY